MPYHTRYLARAIGLFTILMVGVMLIRGTSVIEAAVADQPVMDIYAFVSIGLGVAMIVGHNVWSRGLMATVVTLTGWLVLAKGIGLLLLAPGQVQSLFRQMQYAKYAAAYLSPALLIGLYLTWAGFTAPSKMKTGLLDEA
jgi:hypothetical protein